MNVSHLRQGVLARWSRLCAFLPTAWLPVVGLAGLTLGFEQWATSPFSPLVSYIMISYAMRGLN